MAVQFVNNPKVGDNVKIEIGNSSDLQIYHDGTHSYVESISGATGDLYIKASSDDLVLQAADDVFIYTQGGEDAIIAKGNAAVELYHNNSKKFETTSAGVSVTDDVTITSASAPILRLTNTTGSQSWIQYVGSNDDFIIRDETDARSPLIINGSGDSTFAGSATIRKSTLGGSTPMADGTLVLGAGTTDYFSFRLDSGADLYFDKSYGGVAANVFSIDRSSTNGDITFAGKVSVGGGDTSTAQMALKGQQSLLSFIRGTAGDAQFFMSSDSSRLYFSHTDTQTSNLILKLDASNESATFAGDVTVGALTSGATAQLVVNHEGGSTAIASFKARTNRAQVLVADNDTTGYLVAEGSVFGIGRTGSLSANNINIDSSNNVGIGTTSPTNKLTISDNSAQILLIDTSTTNKGEIEIGDADFTFNLDRDGAISSGKFAWRIDDTTRMELGLDSGDLGQLRLNEYGSGNITGTATFLLGVDENGYIIEESTSGGGTVTGSGAATRVAFWSGTSALSSDANLYWDNSNDRLGIGTSAPGAKLDVRGDGAGFFLQSADHKIARIQPRGTGAEIDKGLFSLFTTTTETVRIDTNGSSWFTGGKIGIGTTSPGNKLHVNSGSTSDIVKFENNNGSMVFGQTTALTSLDLASSNAYRIRQGSSTPFKIETSGAVTFDNVISGVRASFVSTLQDATVLSAEGAYSSSGSVKLFEAKRSGSAVAGNWSYDDATTDMSLGTSTSHSFSLKTGNTRALTIDTSQNVGIGTTSPASKLHVVANDSTIAQFASSGGLANDKVLQIQSGGDRVILDFKTNSTGAAAALAFESGNTERMRIDSSSTVKITSDGTNAAGTILELHFPNNNTNDRCGLINFTNNTGSYATIEGGTSGANNSGYILFKTDNAGTSGERMRIDSSGNVGIGTTSPAHKLDVSDNSTTWAGRILNTNARGYGLLVRSDSTTASDLIFGAYGNGGAGAGYKFAIQAAGNVGIGTISPVTSLDVRGEVSIAYNATYGLRFYNNARNNWSSIGNNVASGTAANLVFKDSTGEVMRITGGDVGIGTTSPSQKLTVNSGTINSVARFESTNDTAQIIIKDDDTTMYFGAKNSVGYISPTGSTPANGICVNTSGNVGIGNTSPTSISANTFSLSVNSSRTDLSGGLISKSNGTVKHQQYWDTGGYNFSLSASSGNFKFTGGNVGIGTTSPSQKLTVGGGGAILQEGPTGGGNNTFQTWQYGTDTNFKLLLKQNVGGGIVKHIFDVTNNGTAYSNNLVIDRGKIGIGTDSPASLLTLQDASSPTIRIVDTTNSVTLLAFAQDSSAGFGTYSNHTLAFFSNSAERMRISTGGNVGIGTTSPSAKLHVNGTAKATKLELDESGSSTGDLSSAAGFIDVIVGGTGYIIPYFSPD